MTTHSHGTPPVLDVPGADPRLINADLAPTAPGGRTWGAFDIFSMWMSDVHSVGGYTFAASLFFLGLTGWQVLVAMVVGIVAVYLLMNLIGRPSLKYGIPYPVVARMAFGVMGANLAAVIRGVVGIVWYGVQTYFASKAVQVLVLSFAPSAEALTHNSILGLSTLGWLSFLFMWLFQLLIFLNGMETIRRFIDFCGPAVYVVMVALAIWILSQSGLSSLSLQLGKPAAGSSLGHMANAAMLIVAYFAALLLNFGDFARFARDERAMTLGNFLGLPLNFLVFAIITVIVTAGTLNVFGEAIMDPVHIVERIGNPWVVALGSITFIVATMGINIVANFVSPAYDIANLRPERISFRLGGLITSILSVLVCPWLFVASPQAITIFVSIFGAVLGPMFGIMICDYYLVKKQNVAIEDLYTLSPQGALYYQSGWNNRALVTLAISGVVSIGLALSGAYGLIASVGDWGWLIGALLGGLVYYALSGRAPQAAPLAGRTLAP
ncbi:NCS1 family nucleobase:cation symporter-1 [Bradyrhizobium sp. U87765 SZCCT0131]|uniref:NCS1 family nucleobase:cation symporter-1 n=1 Tax=unclassified Bradyrhizobium TaxID=2631580 RepID=UPI001BAA5530|nr:MULTISPECIES: NCS1 family nucleobase:cation symporter-1 [unclassified Bradyrhizobium]MBR1222892.1 NCS1 family nucleobase:cation symporter-1 [Bradyrhizobium sp. U87765 SZCCT0131]MBR1262628.1 NCS1 family nucleobase:cation symporter-1 [Bradyrhizobium sp. U87765 SZCCT0134]MBR1308900.1 NCS1 family nucleobase:cation symporter-1 [Bradyrhizobium sp. U87765 SZCCT0110]MBR1318410.1 NCS1 family nucleobase:cation symporter-1 [Bradyrhizobium sp. U87765 SZCCT0109]MBR1352114.1 NCS1 family nucleobase:cation